MVEMIEITDTVNTARAARMVDVTPQTIRDWVREGKLAASRLPSGRIRIPISEIQRLLSTE